MNFLFSQTKQPPAKVDGFELRTESPNTHRLNSNMNKNYYQLIFFNLASKNKFQVRKD
ncbi:hypothetical protein NTG1052_250004 [Candidatus Nitrotoga sp. 1052]|nr:hypothetical protein NTG1052_250004 [Candidatus Nitrotoga sp. 1052]